MLRRVFQPDELAAMKEAEDVIYAMREAGVSSVEELLVENVVQIMPPPVPFAPFWVGGTSLQAQAQ